MQFRTTDMAKWGVGKGSRLTASEVDNNFWQHEQRLDAIEADPPLPVSISSVTTTESSFTIHLTNGSSQGPFALPTAKFNLLGEWTPNTDYLSPNSFITEGGNTYMIAFPHHSASVFDANANDGLGHNFYSLLPFPNAPIIQFLDDGWPPSTALGAYKLFSIPDVGVFLSLRAHTTAATFDPLAEDGGGNPLYQEVFGAIETNRARIQFQFAGKPPSDGSVIMVYIQDDPRALDFAADFLDSAAHLNIACTATIAWTLKYSGVTIGTITFAPGELLDGEGGQFGTFTGAGTGDTPIQHLELLRLVAPSVADATASFLTISLIGSYEDIAS
jgi:hypothetical protein